MTNKPMSDMEKKIREKIEKERRKYFKNKRKKEFSEEDKIYNRNYLREYRKRNPEKYKKYSKKNDLWIKNCSKVKIILEKENQTFQTNAKDLIAKHLNKLMEGYRIKSMDWSAIYETTNKV